MELNGTVRELNGTWGDWHHIFQPELIGIDFFNLDYFNLKGFGGAYHINKRHTRIYILFFRSFWKVRVGEDLPPIQILYSVYSVYMFI